MSASRQPGPARPLIAALAERGVRLTRQRRILLDLIEEADGHVQPSDLLRLGRERDPKMDRATVYRTISLLKGLGLIDELDLLHLEGHEHYYELKSRTGHAHVGCLRCGRIMEHDSDTQRRLTREIERETGWEVGSVRIEVAAICPDCRKADREAPRRPARDRRAGGPPPPPKRIPVEGGVPPTGWAA